MSQLKDMLKRIEDTKSWIRKQVMDADCSGVVFGLSGGIDSAVVAVLCKKVFPTFHKALLLPCGSSMDSTNDANHLVDKFSIDSETVNLTPTYLKLLDTLCTSKDNTRDEAARGNIKARLRMATLYYFANRSNFLVVGTTNYTEYKLGYYTKYGDGGVDIEPIAGLYKTEVRFMAELLDIPRSIINKPPTADLWDGQTDEKELGISYRQIDSVLSGSSKSNDDIEKVSNLIEKSEHKRHMPKGYYGEEE